MVLTIINKIEGPYISAIHIIWLIEYGSSWGPYILCQRFHLFHKKTICFKFWDESFSVMTVHFISDPVTSLSTQISYFQDLCAHVQKFPINLKIVLTHYKIKYEIVLVLKEIVLIPALLLKYELVRPWSKLTVVPRTSSYSIQLFLVKLVLVLVRPCFKLIIPNRHRSLKSPEDAFDWIFTKEIFI